MTRFEYAVIKVHTSYSDVAPTVLEPSSKIYKVGEILISSIQNYGEQGWELCSIAYMNSSCEFYFKRVKAPEVSTAPTLDI